MFRNSQKIKNILNKSNEINSTSSINSSSYTNSKSNLIDKLSDLKLPPPVLLVPLELKNDSKYSSDFSNISQDELDLIDESYHMENDKMIESYKKQIEQLSRQMSSVSKEDFKLLNDLTEKVNHLARTTGVFIYYF